MSEEQKALNAFLAACRDNGMSGPVMRDAINDLVATRLPDVLYDGFAVYQALDEKARRRTGAENVSDVLDAVVKLMRENAL